MATSQPNSPGKTPIWSWALPVAACLFLAGKFSGLLPADSVLVLAVAALILLGAVFASVHHAEVIALRVGDPFGSIVLAISATVIEVALIVSIMLSAKGGSEVLARDTVFATVMLVLNAIVGLCLLLGGAQHREQIFQTDAAAAALSVLGTLSVITLVLPNYTLAKPGPVYEQSQLIFVSIVSVILYGIFLFVQTVRHRHYFLNLSPDADDSDNHGPVPSVATSILSLALLCASLGAVVLLAKVLSPPLETAIEAARLPKALVGVVIAAVVLLPEGTTAILAARKNRLQISLNLALGSALATIGLTIPAVSMAALLLGQSLTLGLGPEESTLLLVTLFISTVTLATGRTTILQGAVHCVLAAVFIFLTAVP
jgi:Ca2+:H+ antiporter